MAQTQVENVQNVQKIHFLAKSLGINKLMCELIMLNITVDSFINLKKLCQFLLVMQHCF